MPSKTPPKRKRSKLVKRKKVGLERAKDDGKSPGRPRREIDWELVKELRNDGLSWQEVADALGMSNAQLYRRRNAAGLVYKEEKDNRMLKKG